MTDTLAIESGALQRIADVLGRELGDAVLATVLDKGDLWVRVERSAWHRAVEVCKRQLGLSWFGFLSGLDWQPAPDMSAEKLFKSEEAGDDEDAVDGDDADDATDEAEVVTEMRTGVAGGDSRFQVMCRLSDPRHHVGVTLKVDLDEADPRLDTLVDLYRGADWHERECWEMFGFTFDGHPGLRHLYLPGAFEGHPLRKDFPLLAREVKPWPGLVNVEQIPAALDPKNQPAPAVDEAIAASGVPSEAQTVPTETAAEAAAQGQTLAAADLPAAEGSAGQISAEQAPGDPNEGAQP